MLLIGPPNLGPYSSEDMVITGHLFGELGLQSTSSYAIAMATADLFPVRLAMNGAPHNLLVLNWERGTNEKSPRP